MDANKATTKKIFLLSSLVIAATVFLVYYPALRLTFFGDDYSFIEIAGRSSLWQYLAWYFDPRVQTAWYRPMQGMRYGLIYALFGARPIAYHLVNVLIHACNCLLLFGIVWRVTRRRRVAILGTLLYASSPLYSVAVFWPGVADFGMTLFLLSSISFWISFRLDSKSKGYLLAVVFFILGLLTKELAVTLPVVLFIIDWGILRLRMSVFAWFMAYLPFVLLLLIYVPMEYMIQARGIFINTYGYGVGSQVMSNLVRYLSALAFPWQLPEPWNYVWLALILSMLVTVVLWKKSIAVGSLAAIGMLTLVPVTPFPWVDLRYLYLPEMISSIFMALIVAIVWTRLGHLKWFRVVTLLLLAIVLVNNALDVQTAAADFNELARQSRVPYRDITQRHPSFPQDTFLYFVDPLPQVSELSGMFFLQYGTSVSVGGDTGATRRADLATHQKAYVIWFDDERRTRELAVDATARESNQPIDFAVPIRLLGYEIPSTQARRGEAFVAILYWQALSKIEENYTIGLFLRDMSRSDGGVISGGAPRVGSLPTSSWRPGEMIIDARVISVPADARVGDYSAEISVPGTVQPVAIATVVVSE